MSRKILITLLIAIVVLATSTTVVAKGLGGGGGGGGGGGHETTVTNNLSVPAIMIGGGNHPDQACVNLVVDEERAALLKQIRVRLRSPSAIFIIRTSGPQTRSTTVSIPRSKRNSTLASFPTALHQDGMYICAPASSSIRRTNSPRPWMPGQ